MPIFNFKREAGFTLVELLIVVTVIGVLGRVLISVINVQQQVKRGNDTIIRSNLQKTVEALEQYRTLEKIYPPDSAPADSIPDNVTAYFAQGWLNGKPTGATYTYWVNATGDAAGVTVVLSTSKVLKYYSTWSQIKECAAGALPSNNLCP